MLANPVLSVSVLLRYYSFDARGGATEEIAKLWLAEYPAKWVIAAIIESIYQGRYKTSSIDNILSLWQRDGRPQHHFDIDFADLVCGKLLKNITQDAASQDSEAQRVDDSKIVPLNPPTSYEGKYSNYVLLAAAGQPDFTAPEPLDLMNQEEFNIPNYGIGKRLKLVRKLN